MQTRLREDQKSVRGEDVRLPGTTPGHRQPSWQSGCLGNGKAWARRTVGSNNGSQNTPLRDVLGSLLLGSWGLEAQSLPRPPHTEEAEWMDMDAISSLHQIPPGLLLSFFP